MGMGARRAVLASNPVRFLYSDGRQALRRNRRYSKSIKERKMMNNEPRKIPGVGDLVKFTYNPASMRAESLRTALLG